MRLVILDRDGVINYDSVDYIKSLQEWRPIPGSLEAIARLHRAGYRVVVATNQSGIGRGLLSMDTLAAIHGRMLEQVRKQGGEIDAIFFCPHTPEDGCDCRKPAPGLFKEIAKRLQTNLVGVYVVGDAERDVLAARKGAQTLKQSTVVDGVPVFDDLAAFVDALLSGRLVTH
jgi:D-glycero-D-manno-heptose 1,7-bisphosphate phosphatase